MASSTRNVETETQEIPDLTTTIKVRILGYQNISPSHSIADLITTTCFMGQVLGVTTPTPVVANVMVETDQTFTFTIDPANSKDLDNIASNPVIFQVVEHQGKLDPDIYPPLMDVTETASDNLLTQMSAADLGDQLNWGGSGVDKSKIMSKEDEKAKKKADKDSKKASKSSKDTKSKDSKGGKSKGTTEDLEGQGPTDLGCAALDLLPLILGRVEMCETMMLRKPLNARPKDDEMETRASVPRIVVSVTLEGISPLLSILTPDKKPNILNVTLESVYNIPRIMTDAQYRCRLCTSLPLSDGDFDTVVFTDGVYACKRDEFEFKRWFGDQMGVNFDNFTGYKLDRSHPERIRNKVEDLNLGPILQSPNTPRIEWNVLKRMIFTEKAERAFLLRVYKYRHICIEIYMCPLQEPEPEPKGKGKGSPDKGKKGKKEEPVEKPEEPALHMMALADVSTLGYPGVRKVRVAVPLRTFHYEEAKQFSGLQNSFFKPKVPEPEPLPLVCPVEPPPEVPSPPKGGKGKGKDKSSKSSKGSKKKGGDPNLANLLPPGPAPPQPPSVQIFDEWGNPTFIILELELHNTMMEPRPLEDLTKSFMELIPAKPRLPKTIVLSQLGQEHYREVIRQLTEDLYFQHRNYEEESNICYCESDNRADLLNYLQRTGIYQTYLSTMTRATVLLVSEKFNYSGDPSIESKEYQNFVAEVYTYMVKEMNSVMNEMILTRTEKAKHPGNLISTNPMLLYAKEAVELGALILADRYYLERIATNEDDPEVWLDYAIFLKSKNQTGEALECLREVLNLDVHHNCGLLMFGLMLAEDGKEKEAETCLLLLTLHHPRWTEGWMALAVLYDIQFNREGAEVAEDMASKYMDDPRSSADRFATIEDLAWSPDIVPRTNHFRLAMLLIKMRLFNLAERTLAHEIIKNNSIVEYLLGVISYYRRTFDHAIRHLMIAKKSFGFCYAIGSMIGHCLFMLHEYKDAERVYKRALSLYNIPEDTHLVNIRSATINEALGHSQRARKLILLCCKYSPTPYTWLGAGLLFLRQRDFLSCEECLIQANLCDGKLPEIWAYLALVNSHLDRPNEAEICYRQAIKNNLLSSSLKTKLDIIFDNVIFKKL